MGKHVVGRAKANERADEKVGKNVDRVRARV